MNRPGGKPSLRRTLREGGAVIGTWLNSGSAVVAELLAATGFDFVCVDSEHSAVDLPQAQQLFQAIRSGAPRCAALVRLHGVDYSFVKRFLDAGADGVIAPLVRTREEALRLVEACKYPPDGMRGVGFCRANAYGLDLAAEFAEANERTMIAVQIEHIDAVREIDAILSVPGIDAAFIGPYDLTASMGIAAQFAHPDYLHARDVILAACQRHRIAPGIHVVQPNPAEARDRLGEGYRLLAYSLDITMIATVANQALKDLRASAAASPKL